VRLNRLRGPGRDFRPIVRGGHLQTLYGFWTRRKLRWTPPTEDFLVDAHPGIPILSRASFQPGHRERFPALVLVHGMGGWDHSSYLLSMGLYAYRAGYHVIRMNMRGAGASFETCPWLYHAGLDGDLLAVARAVARISPRVGLFGASLGANQVLLALGRSAPETPPAVRAAVAVSPPLDLEECCRALRRLDNRPYVSYFLERLKANYVRVQARNPFYEEGRERGVKTVREFDERITTPYGGFASAADYYRASSAGPHLTRIDRPALIIAAEDDPMIPGGSVRKWPLPESGVVIREVHRTGGHVGFAASTEAPGGFWAAERALAFFNQHLRD
jgi:hypothetical protein